MKRYLSVLLVGCAVCALASCGGDKKRNEIIARKPIIVKSSKVMKMGDYSQSRKITWVGASYTVNVTLTADESLPVVEEGAQKYYDNKIQLRITRTDGSEFFNRTFTKADFSSYTDANFNGNGALLGIVYDHAEGDYLYFAASVGSPDKSSDEYIPLVVRLSRTGAVSISKDTQLDTSGSAQSDNDDMGGGDI